MEKKTTEAPDKDKKAIAAYLEAANTAVNKSLLRDICKTVETYDTLLLISELVDRENTNQRSLNLATTVGNGKWAHKVSLEQAAEQLDGMLANAAARLTEAILVADPAQLNAYILDTAFNSHPLTRYDGTAECRDWLEGAGYFRTHDPTSFLYFYAHEGSCIDYGIPSYEKFKALKESL